MNTTRNSKPGRDFSEDLARFCFAPEGPGVNQRLAWANAICLSCLAIGLIGLKPRTLTGVHRPGPSEEAVTTLIEPTLIPVQPVTAGTPQFDQDFGEPHAGGPAIAVTLNSPAVAFPVPTVGNVLVPISLAQPPPEQPLAGAVPRQSANPDSLGMTGPTGSRPAPAYPPESLRAQEQGTVLLLIEVNAVGRVSRVSISESSGHRRLDQAAVEAVKQFWYFGPGQGPRLYESPIVFQLR